MPWSVAPMRLGRSWPMAPHAPSLRARWDRLVGTDGAARERLFGPSRARTQQSSVAALPGQPTSTGRFARESGRCPAPVRVLYAPFDEQWLLPDHRLIDAARPELWRVADDRQLFAVEQGCVPEAGGPALLATALLPVGGSASGTKAGAGRAPAGRPSRIRPLHRRPGGLEPNLAPGLLPFLSGRYGQEVTPQDVLAWVLAAARSTPEGCAVPLPEDGELWSRGVGLGRRMLTLQLRGAHGGERPRMPGGRRPYVRAAIPAHPAELLYDREEEVLQLGEGRVSPVPAGAWDFHVSGVRVLGAWFERRTVLGEPGTLDAVRPASWPQEWTSELLELITVLGLLYELRPQQEELADCPQITRTELLRAGVLPVPAGARRPASVLDHHEEGPEGQFVLL
ncbi:type ISP restriction/modification enzyme [Streptomyces sp. NPDC051219]|uniref:type ISP restriction/modification enzyme n=1 Tax=Streptomyces sp. NPDC051219 TaxID=3155283 RepID=UPI0034163516